MSTTFWTRDTRGIPRSPQDIYARHLLSPRGYPLWMPDPSRQLLAYRRDGLRIGDVGVIIPETGGFDVYFNVCLPRNHPFHQATGVPDNFEPIRLTAMDIRTATNVENPGRIIATSSVRTARIVEQPGDTSSRTQSSGLEYEFNLSSSEGALLILPDGAECEDLRNHNLFLQAAAQHGADWYRFAEEKVGQIIGRDSLYLITGFHKTFSWSLAAFEETAGSAEYLARCRLPQLRGDITTPGTWNTTRVLHHWRVGPDEYFGIPNQAPFIRGFKIARRTRMFGRRISVETDVPSTRSSRVSYSGAVRRGPWWGFIFGGCVGDRGVGSSRSDMQDEIVADPEFHANEIQNHGDTVIHRMSEASQAFHPSDIINRYLLNKVPSANIAIIHDNEWIALLEKNMIRSKDLAQESLLEGLVSKNYRVISEGGAVYLRSRSTGTSNDGEVGATMEARKSDSGYQAAVIVNEIPSAELGNVTTLHVPHNIPRVNPYSFSSNDRQDHHQGDPAANEVRFSNVNLVARVLGFFSRLCVWASRMVSRARTPHEEQPHTTIIPIVRGDESARWKALLESEATIERYLSFSIDIELATFIRCVTFRVFLMVFLEVDLDVGNPILFARLKEITGAISEFYDDSQGNSTLPPEVKGALDRWFPPNYLDRILPAYEALWRIIATIVVTCEEDEARSLRWVMLDFRDNPRDRQFSASFGSDTKSASAITDEAVGRVMPIIARPQYQAAGPNWPLSCIQNTTWSDWQDARPPTVREALKFAALLASMVIGRIGEYYGVSGPADGGVGGSQGAVWNQRRIFKINRAAGHHSINIVHTGTSKVEVH